MQQVFSDLAKHLRVIFGGVIDDWHNVTTEQRPKSIREILSDQVYQVVSESLGTFRHRACLEHERDDRDQSRIVIELVVVEEVGGPDPQETLGNAVFALLGVDQREQLLPGRLGVGRLYLVPRQDVLSRVGSVVHSSHCCHPLPVQV